MEEKVLIEAKNLKKYFKVGANSQLHAVDGVNFKIKRGTTLGVVGESGCGKSTLGRLLLRLYDVTDGQIIYDGTDITKLNAKELKPIRARMQMIFQDPSGSLDPRKSVKELIGEPLKIYKACKNRDEYDARIAEIMETVGLDERYAESFSHELDGGRRQRIGIGRALAMDPEFIICDEPVSALDVSIQAQILNLLMDLQDEKKLTYVFITHDLSVVKHISHEIMVMYLGQCVEYAEAGICCIGAAGRKTAAGSRVHRACQFAAHDLGGKLFGLQAGDGHSIQQTLGIGVERILEQILGLGIFHRGHARRTDKPCGLGSRLPFCGPLPLCNRCLPRQGYPLEGSGTWPLCQLHTLLRTRKGGKINDRGRKKGRCRAEAA